MDFNSTLSAYFDQSDELSFSSSDIRQFQAQANQSQPVRHHIWMADKLIQISQGNCESKILPDI